MEWSPAFAERNDVVFTSHRQHFAIAPHVRSAGVESLPRQKACDPLQIITDKERLAALGAHVVRFPRLVFAMAEGALEFLDVHSCLRWGGPTPQASNRD